MTTHTAGTQVSSASNDLDRAPSDHVGKRAVSEIRKDFPILDRQFVYLDNAATSQKPVQVLDAVAHYYRHSNANVHRAIHRLAAEATGAFERSRELVRSFIGAGSKSEIIFTGGTTDSINMVAQSFGRAMLHEGDEIILTEMEHHSNLVPWQLLAQEKGLNLKFIPFLEDGTLDLALLDSLWSERVRLVAATHMSNVLGTINDIRTLSDFAHSRSVPVLVDGAQSVPHLPVDVQSLGADLLAFSGHKMCAPMGIGVLYGKEELLDRMPPAKAGGEMISAVWLDHAKWNDLPYKFEAGTPNVAGAIGLGAAIEYLDALGMQSIHEYEQSLTAYALESVRKVPGLTVYGDADRRGGVVSFNVEGVHAHDVAQFLDNDGIAVRAGHHCAHPLMRKLCVPSTTRASFYFYNTGEEIDRLTASLFKVGEYFGHGL